jgi:wyosine [tRNA(Phe)-imidazoG37] synthetase (radical SAM superfamily)
MTGILFDNIVFGPIYSRRLGNSLGINLLPTNSKICNFNCVYCECGWTPDLDKNTSKFPDLETVINSLNQNFLRLKNENKIIDSITFAGNGEPTLYPDFETVVDEIYKLRNQFFPQSKISLLTNGGTLGNKKISESLKKIDNNIIKLDAGSNELFHIINGTGNNIKIEHLVENLKMIDFKIIIQSLFLRGIYNGISFDNTVDTEVNLWLKHLMEINPEYVMIYPINRQTPLNNIEKISRKELQIIAGKVENLGIKALVYD